MPLAPGEDRRQRLVSNKDPHRGERVGYVNQCVVCRQAGHVPEMDRSDKEPHARVKGEFVGKLVPPDGNRTILEEKTGLDGSERIPDGSDVN